MDHWSTPPPAQTRASGAATSDGDGKGCLTLERQRRRFRQGAQG
ncbi:MAG: hypothetical protein ACQER3_06715 [Pseudomonadota bacterium]|nr:hypothetical protein [Serratia fonticola]